MDYTKAQCLRRIKELDLIEEATKRYKGKKAKCLHGCINYDGHTDFKLCEGDVLRYAGGRGCIHSYGIWAEVIEEVPEYTMEELTSKLGYEFKIKK